MNSQAAVMTIRHKNNSVAAESMIERDAKLRALAELAKLPATKSGKEYAYGRGTLCPNENLRNARKRRPGKGGKNSVNDPLYGMNEEEYSLLARNRDKLAQMNESIYGNGTCAAMENAQGYMMRSRQQTIMSGSGQKQMPYRMTYNPAVLHPDATDCHSIGPRNRGAKSGKDRLRDRHQGVCQTKFKGAVDFLDRGKTANPKGMSGYCDPLPLAARKGGKQVALINKLGKEYMQTKKSSFQRFN